MYYVYLLGLVIVGLLLLIIPNYLIYKIDERFEVSSIAGNNSSEEYIEEYTSKELELYNEMVDTVYDLTDELFAMEMKATLKC